MTHMKNVCLMFVFSIVGLFSFNVSAGLPSMPTECSVAASFQNHAIGLTLSTPYYLAADQYDVYKFEANNNFIVEPISEFGLTLNTIFWSDTIKVTFPAERNGSPYYTEGFWFSFGHGNTGAFTMDIYVWDNNAAVYDSTITHIPTSTNPKIFEFKHSASNVAFVEITGDYNELGIGDVCAF